MHIHITTFHGSRFFVMFSGRMSCFFYCFASVPYNRAEMPYFRYTGAVAAAEPFPVSFSCLPHFIGLAHAAHSLLNACSAVLDSSLPFLLVFTSLFYPLVAAFCSARSRQPRFIPMRILLFVTILFMWTTERKNGRAFSPFLVVLVRTWFLRCVPRCCWQQMLDEQSITFCRSSVNNVALFMCECRSPYLLIQSINLRRLYGPHVCRLHSSVT